MIRFPALLQHSFPKFNGARNDQLSIAQVVWPRDLCVKRAQLNDCIINRQYFLSTWQYGARSLRRQDFFPIVPMTCHHEAVSRESA